MADLEIVEMPLLAASEESLAGYGRLVDDRDADIEIVTWPAPGWRPVDPGTGNEAGSIEGRFEFWWQDDHLYGRNEAVDDRYLLGRGVGSAPDDGSLPERLLIGHANYHPDGGQLFFPLSPTPFVAPLARPGDDVRPEHFVAFYCDGRQGLYIHPGVWHEAIVPLAAQASFHDKQGRVHARISVDFPKEFGCHLAVPLRRP